MLKRDYAQIFRGFLFKGKTVCSEKHGTVLHRRHIDPCYWSVVGLIPPLFLLIKNSKEE